MFYKSKTVIIFLKISQVPFEGFFRIYTKHPHPCYMGVTARGLSPLPLELCINMTGILIIRPTSLETDQSRENKKALNSPIGSSRMEPTASFLCVLKFVLEKFSDSLSATPCQRVLIGGPNVGYRLKSHYLIGYRLKFSTIVGCQ